MLASRRTAAASWLRVRKNGLPERMSSAIRVGCSESPAAGEGMRPLPRCGVLTAGEPALVTEQEPEHHRDARVPAGDRIRLGQVLRLLRPTDAEVPDRRPR